jgi:hypothetical protein
MIKSRKMRWAGTYHEWKRGEMYIKFWSEDLKGRDHLENLGVDGRIILDSASGPALRPTQPPIQCAPAAFSLEVKQPGREADRSPPSIVKVKNAWSYTSTLPIRLHGVVIS